MSSPELHASIVVTASDFAIDNICIGKCQEGGKAYVYIPLANCATLLSRYGFPRVRQITCFSDRSSLSVAVSVDNRLTQTRGDRNNLQTVSHSFAQVTMGTLSRKGSGLRAVCT